MRRNREEHEHNLNRDTDLSPYTHVHMPYIHTHDASARVFAREALTRYLYLHESISAHIEQALSLVRICVYYTRSSRARFSASKAKS